MPASSPTAPSPGQQILLAPPGRLMHSLGVVAMLGLLHAASSLRFFEGAGFALLALAVSGHWLVRAYLFAIANWRIGPSHRTGRKTWRRWALWPAISFVTVLLVTLNLPFLMRFAYSRNDLTHLAQQALAAGPAMRSPNPWTRPAQRAGAFDVVVVEVKPSGEVDFRVPGTEFMRSFSGFIYCPTGTPFDPEGSVEPLGGPWYEWHTSW